MKAIEAFRNLLHDIFHSPALAVLYLLTVICGTISSLYCFGVIQNHVLDNAARKESALIISFPILNASFEDIRVPLTRTLSLLGDNVDMTTLYCCENRNIVYEPLRPRDNDTPPELGQTAKAYPILKDGKLQNHEFLSKSIAYQSLDNKIQDGEKVVLCYDASPPSQYAFGKEEYRALAPIYREGIYFPVQALSENIYVYAWEITLQRMLTRGQIETIHSYFDTSPDGAQLMYGYMSFPDSDVLPLFHLNGPIAAALLALTAAIMGILLQWILPPHRRFGFLSILSLLLLSGIPVFGAVSILFHLTGRFIFAHNTLSYYTAIFSLESYFILLAYFVLFLILTAVILTVTRRLRRKGARV